MKELLTEKKAAQTTYFKYKDETNDLKNYMTKIRESISEFTNLTAEESLQVQPIIDAKKNSDKSLAWAGRVENPAAHLIPPSLSSSLSLPDSSFLSSSSADFFVISVPVPDPFPPTPPTPPTPPIPVVL